MNRHVLGFAIVNAAIIEGHCVAAVMALVIGHTVTRWGWADYWGIWLLVGICAAAAGTGTMLWMLEGRRK